MIGDTGSSPIVVAEILAIPRTMPHVMMLEWQEGVQANALELYRLNSDGTYADATNIRSYTR